MSKAIREVYGTVLKELGETNENIVVLDADLAAIPHFAENPPDRCYHCKPESSISLFPAIVALSSLSYK